MAPYRVGPLPDGALAASARFHAEDLPRLQALLEAGQGHLGLIFAPADHTHRAWRLAVVQQLARENAPTRINALVGDDEGAIAAALSYLDMAEGVTGQLLPLDTAGAGKVLSIA